MLSDLRASVKAYRCHKRTSSRKRRKHRQFNRRTIRRLLPRNRGRRSELARLQRMLLNSQPSRRNHATRRVSTFHRSSL